MEEAKTGCQKVWKDALSRCAETLGEDDYALIMGFQSPEELMEEISQMESRCRDTYCARMLSKMNPYLSRLAAFVTLVVVSMGAHDIRTACIWGSIHLLIYLASASQETLTEIATTLGELEQHLALFEIYSEGVELDPAFLRSLFEILVDLVLCSATAIKHFRKAPIENVALLLAPQGPKGSVRDNFREIFQQLSRKANHLKELVAAQNVKQQTADNARILQQLREISRSQAVPQSTVSLPCHTLPFPRNPTFFGRESLLESINNALASNDTQQHISTIALWGIGGVGKSQMALEVAHEQYAGGRQIVLWIASETSVEIASSFNKAASHLRLPGFSPTNTPEQNKFIVVQYLQETRVRWLMIFDNVEDQRLVHDSTPVTGNGHILMTCRSEFTAASLCLTLFEIPVFSTTDGGELLLQIIGNSSPSSSERDSSRTLSERLGGLALAINIIGRQVRLRGKTIEQFLPTYYQQRRSVKKQPRRGIINHYYTKDLDAVWETSFKSLTPEAARLLQLLCFVSPDDIPDSLFTNGENLPADYAFMADPSEWDEVKIELLDLALIAVNPKTSLMSIHRLTREAYYDSMTPAEKLTAFSVTLSLFQVPFSRSAGSHLYNRWQTCSKLIQHVQALGERYRELGETTFYSPNPLLSKVFNDAAWYLLETGFFKGSTELTDIACTNCVDKRSMEYADLLDTIGTVYERQAHTAKATERFQEMLSITLERQTPGDDDDGEEVPRAYNAVTNGLVGMWRAEEAIAYADKAVAYGPQAPEQRLAYHPDRYLRCRSCAYLYMGDLQSAKRDLAEAEYWQDLKHGEDSHYHGEAAYISCKVAFAEGDFDKAYDLADRAYRLLSPGKPMHSFVAATRYQQGRIRYMQGRYAEALTQFRDSLAIGQWNELSNGVQSYAGTTARCKWWISRVLEHQGLTEPARVLREEAELSKKLLYDTGLFVHRDGEELAYDSLVALLFR